MDHDSQLATGDCVVAAVVVSQIALKRSVTQVLRGFEFVDLELVVSVDPVDERVDRLEEPAELATVVEPDSLAVAGIGLVVDCRGLLRTHGIGAADYFGTLFIVEDLSALNLYLICHLCAH